MLNNIIVNKENVGEVIKNTVDWIKEILEGSKAEGIVIGMSGGIDCSIVARLCQMATQNVTLVLMPYGESMDRTGDKDHAMKLINKFRFDYIEVNITNSVNTIADSITKHNVINIEGLPISNIKPRVRMTTLYTIGQSKNYLVAGTGNLSEKTMGYFTKWGDGASDFNPIGSFTKTEVGLIARKLGIPNEIINKAPSAGLWTGQTDEDEMGVTYEDIDRFILTGEATTKEATAKIERVYKMTQHKRNPIPVFKR